MSRLMIIFLGFVLAACGVPPRAAQDVSGGDGPTRIVSLDYCADQYVLKFADREDIRAVSPDAARDFSFMQEAARGIPVVRRSAEDVLMLKPDLVVRSYGGGPGATALFERAGIPVLEVGWVPDIPSILENTQRMANALGAPEKGEAVTREMRARLERLNRDASGKSVLYMTSGGVTTGPGSLVHEMIAAAGLENFEQAPGWRSLPLERLSREKPDVLAVADFGNFGNYRNNWSPANHPVARRALKSRDVVPLEGAWTSCNGWFLMEAIEALAEEADE